MDIETEPSYTPGTLILNSDGSLSHKSDHLPITVGILPFEKFRPNLKRAVECWNACAGMRDPASALAQAREALSAAIDEVQPAIADACRAALKALGN